MALGISGKRNNTQCRGRGYQQALRSSESGIHHSDDESYGREGPHMKSVEGQSYPEVATAEEGQFE